MTDTDIIQALREKLHLEGGRHLYGVLGSYQGLESFAKKLQKAKDSVQDCSFRAGRVK
jgi:hypothetical protein